MDNDIGGFNAKTAREERSDYGRVIRDRPSDRGPVRQRRRQRGYQLSVRTGRSGGYGETGERGTRGCGREGSSGSGRRLERRPGEGYVREGAGILRIT